MEAKHSLGIISITSSRLLERFGYYGMRSILFLYMLHGPLNFSEENAASTYGILTAVITLLPFIGGLVGDLLLGSRKASIIAGFIQALGCFLLCIPNSVGLYCGLGLIALGVGLYNPNIISQISILYKNKQNLMDSALLIFYIGINIGAFLAPVIIGFFNDKFGYQIGFIVAGIAILAAQLILILSKKWLSDVPLSANKNIIDESPIKMSPIKILVLISLFLFVPLYWILFQNSSYVITMASEKINSNNDLISFSMLTQMINPIIMIVVGIMLAVVWTFVKVSSILKLAIGFLIMTLSCFLINVISKDSSGVELFIIVFLILQAISELFIGPIAISIICQHGSLKWQATLIGGYLTFSSLISTGSSFLIIFLEDLSTPTSVIITSIILIVIALIYFTLYFLSKRSNEELLSQIAQ